MKDKINLGLQLFLGLAFLVFGLNKFFGFPPPPELKMKADLFFAALSASGYMIQLIATVEIVSGILLLARRFTALALVLLAPLSVNIVAFHLALDPAGGVPAYLLAGLNLYLLFLHLPKYKAMLSAT